jgi:hypothetical protein
MAVDIITQADLEMFRIRLLEDIKKILQPINAPRKEWLKSGEVRKVLKISPNTLLNLRIARKLQPTKIGGILYYRFDEIERLLDGNRK